MGAERDDPMQIQVVARAFRLLEVFSGPVRNFSLSQLAVAAGMDKSGTQRLVHTLLGLGYLERDESGLRPGRRLLERASDHLRWDRLAQLALPVLGEMNQQRKEAVDLSRFEGVSMIYLLRLHSRRRAFHPQIIGMRVPTYCTSTGRAALSALPEEEAVALLEGSTREARTAQTLTEVGAIMAKVREARRLGYALTPEEYMPGEVGIAAPVLDVAGRPIASVRMTASTADWTLPEFTRLFAPGVMEAAATITGLLR
ncbi:IclR family transcriptional regulator [Roseomonas populi]|uniref:IclR family transcriptional regulator n=1 Tax=Roseomonas populi TaxID=3121582 RepID=A0ABT1XD15_9PROT|nr:IclR family transcriptional regulator [Roseomonas pecuniae]MCR0985614.1 IclR family transcriptional regulator [Roseomonas pecuniae]